MACAAAFRRQHELARCQIRKGSTMRPRWLHGGYATHRLHYNPCVRISVMQAADGNLFACSAFNTPHCRLIGSTLGPRKRSSIQLVAGTRCTLGDGVRYVGSGIFFPMPEAPPVYELVDYAHPEPDEDPEDHQDPTAP
jgi:hypothetical protein